MKAFNVAIDGPSGAGKSSIADAIALRYGLHHLDTGAMYRAIALYMNRLGLQPQSSAALEQALESLSLNMTRDGRVLLNGEDVSEAIRDPQVSALASSFAALPAVRKKLVAMQKEIAENKGYILDGRDICDVVLPDAEVKIYLDAAPQARAKRRMLQDQQKGKEMPYEDVLKAIIERDRQDSNRKEAPLRISDAATVVDSSDLSFDETVEAIARLIEQSLKEV